MRVSSSRRTVALLLSVIGLVLCRPSVCSAADRSAPAAITAVGDIHGDFDHLVSILQRSGLIDTQQRWTGGRRILVQTGDVLDRGPKAREAMDLLMLLQKEAAKQGGEIVALLGNHEVMNIMGDLRYVTPENYASFADKNSEKREHSAYRQYLDWRNHHKELLASIAHIFPESSEQEWVAQHPPGFIEQREAFSPEGKYGKWLRERPAVVELNHILFVHGGIDPGLSTMAVEAMNRRVHEELAGFDQAKAFFVAQHLVLPFFTLQEVTAVVQAEVAARQNAPGSRHRDAGSAQVHLPEHTQLQVMKDFLQYGEWLSVAANGPLWFRGYDQWNEEQLAASLPPLMAAYHLQAIVVGHTPQRDGRIRSRLEGKVFLIDTGMLSSYYPGGRASALEIRDGADFTAEYMDQKVVLTQGRH